MRLLRRGKNLVGDSVGGIGQILNDVGSSPNFSYNGKTAFANGNIEAKFSKVIDEHLVIQNASLVV